MWKWSITALLIFLPSLLVVNLSTGLLFLYGIIGESASEVLNRLSFSILVFIYFVVRARNERSSVAIALVVFAAIGSLALAFAAFQAESGPLFFGIWMAVHLSALIYDFAGRRRASASSLKN